MVHLPALRRAAALPFELADASRSKAEAEAARAKAEAAEGEGGGKGELTATVDQDTRLNVRHLDLRTAANQAIFRIQVRRCMP